MEVEIVIVDKGGENSIDMWITNLCLKENTII